MTSMARSTDSRAARVSLGSTFEITNNQLGKISFQGKGCLFTCIQIIYNEQQQKQLLFRHGGRKSLYNSWGHVTMLIKNIIIIVTMLIET